MDENPLTSAVKAILQFSPPMALLVVLIFFGIFLKKTPLQDWTIPILLMITGGIVYPFIAEIGKITNYTMRSPVMYNVLIGGCLGGAATGLHQIVKKFAQRNFSINIDNLTSSDTTIISKDSVDTGKDIVAREKEIEGKK